LKRPLATFDFTEEVRSVEGGVVTAQSGIKHPLKQIRTIPLDSTDVEPRFGANTAGPARKRARGNTILDELQELLQAEGSSLALTRASQLLREAFRAACRDYDEALKVVRGRLIDLIRLDERFKVVEKGGGYYVALR
jgi:hypothetical protein